MLWYLYWGQHSWEHFLLPVPQVVEGSIYMNPRRCLPHSLLVILPLYAIEQSTFCPKSEQTEENKYICKTLNITPVTTLRCE